MKLSDMSAMQQSAVRNYFAFVQYRMDRLCHECGKREEQLLVTYRNPDLISIDRQNLWVLCRKCYSNSPAMKEILGKKKEIPEDIADMIRASHEEGKTVTSLMSEFSLSRDVIKRVLSE